MSKLFKPKFGESLSAKLLDAIKIKGIIDFDLFDATDPVTKVPMNSSTFEIFSVEDYLSEIQFALDLSPSVKLSSPNFNPSDIFDSLYPSSVPSVKGMVEFVKKQIVPKLIEKLTGLFDVEISASSGGMSVDTPTVGNSGLSLGDFSNSSTQLFPPR